MPKLYDEALSFVLDERAQIDDATSVIRDDIRKARRNYECKFDSPIDLATGKRKTFYPMTTQEVDAVSPRFSLNPEALRITTKEPGMKRKAMIWEELMKSLFIQMRFETRIKPHFTTFTNEGTLVCEIYWDQEKNLPEVCFHDLKDIFIFPKEPSLALASMFGLRRKTFLSALHEDERYDQGQMENIGTSDVVAEPAQLSQYQTMQYEIGKFQYQTELSTVELYERHGWFPKNLFTGKDKDAEEMIDGTITVADPDGAARVIEISDLSRRMNFAEAWYLKRPYLWYGRGIGIALKDYQFLMNKIINRRDDNEDVLHRGMFLKQRGLTVEARQEITGTGIWIDVDSPNQITQLRTQDITGAAYQGEANILNGVQRLNGTYQIALGGGSANSASEAAIKDRNTGTRLGDPQAYLNDMFTQLVRQAMELCKKNLPKGTVVKLTGDDEKLALFDDFKLKEVNKGREKEGLSPISQMEFDKAMEQFGDERFISIGNMKLLDGEFEPQIDMDASLLKNKAGAAQQILEAIQIAGQIPQVVSTLDFSDLFSKWMDLQGIKVKKLAASPAMGGLPESGGIENTVSGNPTQDLVKSMLSQAGAPRAEQVS